MDGGLGIGALARETGCKVPTIRYYEDIGLLPSPPRSQGGQRRYGKVHVARLRFIRHARELGFPQDEVRELLRLKDHPEQPCEAADEIARRQLLSVEHRIARLNALREELERMVAQCVGGSISDCRIIEVLTDHSLCLHGDHAFHAGEKPHQR